jgi:integrase
MRAGDRAPVNRLAKLRFLHYGLRAFRTSSARLARGCRRRSLRISEALGLLDVDVDLRASVLTIRQSKFGKTRLVPLHPSAVEAMACYRAQRARHVRTTPESPFFVASRGQLLGQPVGDRQVHAGARSRHAVRSSAR